MALTPRPWQDPAPSLLDEHMSKMRTLSPKALLVVLNPSPVFEAVAIFAEQLVLKGDETWPREIDGDGQLSGAKAEGTNECAF